MTHCAVDCAPGACARSAPRRRRPRRARSGRGRSSRLVPCQRSRKCWSTSATAGPSIRTAASCQPIPPRATCDGVSHGSPPSSVRSMPPTKATRPSITIDLLVVAVREPGAAVRVRLDPRVPRERVEHLANLPLRGLEHREREPPSTRARARRPAPPARRAGCAPRPAPPLARDGARARRTSPPGGRTTRARASSAAIAGSASEPSTSTSSVLPWPRRKASVRVRELGGVERVLPADVP